MFKEFKAFVMRGNVVDLAVGIVIGAAFGRIISSFVNDILMPPVGLVLRGIDFSNLFIVLRGGPFRSLAEVKSAGAPSINYGLFLNNVIDFLIVAFVLFLVIRFVNRLHRDPEATPDTKPCPYCYLTIPIRATRCPNCAADLEAPQAQRARRENPVRLPLTPADRDRFARAWQSVRGRFADDPRSAITEAHHLVVGLLRVRGYHVGDTDFDGPTDEGAGHADPVTNLRETLALARWGSTTTEGLRIAMKRYGALVENLLDGNRELKNDSTAASHLLGE